MKSLYIFKSTSFNITNLPQWCFYLSRDDLYQSCTPIFTNNQLDLEIGGFAQKFSNDVKASFRDINWSNCLTKLDELFNSNEKSIAFAVNSAEQLGILKNHFKDCAVTISCSYNHDFYKTMLDWYVHRHLYLQNHGTVEITKHDQELRNSGIDLVQYYTRSFDQMQLIPLAMEPVGEYDIPIKDFFQTDKFFEHMSCIGAAATIKSKNFYNDWRNTQTLQGTQL